MAHVLLLSVHVLWLWFSCMSTFVLQWPLPCPKLLCCRLSFIFYRVICLQQLFLSAILSSSVVKCLNVLMFVYFACLSILNVCQMFVSFLLWLSYAGAGVGLFGVEWHLIGSYDWALNVMSSPAASSLPFPAVSFRYRLQIGYRGLEMKMHVRYCCRCMFPLQ